MPDPILENIETRYLREYLAQLPVGPGSQVVGTDLTSVLGLVTSETLEPIVEGIVGEVVEPVVVAAVDATRTAFIPSPPTTPLVESAYSVSLGQGDRATPVRISLDISGETTAGTPGAGGGSSENSYRNAVELTPDYIFLKSTTGWNNTTFDNNGRTGIYARRVKLLNEGQGDLVAYNASVRIRSQKPGATHWLANPAGVIINGTVVNEAEGGYINPLEWYLIDKPGGTATFTATRTNGSPNLTGMSGTYWPGDIISGVGIPGDPANPTTRTYIVSVDRTAGTAVMSANAIATSSAAITRQLAYSAAMVGLVVNGERHRDAGPGPSFGGIGVGAIWHGARFQSRGTVAWDTMISGTGKFHSGLDLTMAGLEFVNNNYIALPADARIYINGNAGGINTVDTLLRADHRMTGGFDDWIGYNDALNVFEVVIGNSSTLKVSATQVSVTTLTASENINLVAGKNLFHTGLRVVGPRQLGVSNWTGTFDGASKATYTAAVISNPPTQAEVQAIADALQNVSRGHAAFLRTAHSATGHGLVGD